MKELDGLTSVRRGSHGVPVLLKEQRQAVAHTGVGLYQKDVVNRGLSHVQDSGQR